MFVFFFYTILGSLFFFFFSSRRRHTRSTRDWSSDVCYSDLADRPSGGGPKWADPRPWPEVVRRPARTLGCAPGVNAVGVRIGTWILERYEANPGRVEGNLGARREPQLGENGADVALDRRLGDPQLTRDLLVGESTRHQIQDLSLALREGLVAAHRAQQPGDRPGR